MFVHENFDKMMKVMKVIFICIVLVVLANPRMIGQVVNIPDPAFLQALIKSGVDVNNDGKIQTSEALAITNLTVSSAGIIDLSGIEAFTNLDSLDCSSNQLTRLNLSQNTRLTSLNCFINKLTDLDVSKNAGLMNLSCSNNKLTSLNTTGDSALTLLDCGFNKLANMDVSSNKNLKILECYTNVLDTLNLSGNSHLTTLYCGNNKLRYLDLSKNTVLNFVDCQFNVLQSINLTANTNLTYLACFSNQLINLDLTNNRRLVHLDCGQNLYTHLDLSKNDSLVIADCSQSPDLKSICVKDTNLVKSKANFFKDDHTQWTENCNMASGIPDPQKQYLAEAYPNPGREGFYLSLQQNANVRIFNATGAEVERFANVQHIRFGQNYLPGLYVVRIIFPDNNTGKILKVVKE